jgi:competence protein ComEC
MAAVIESGRRERGPPPRRYQPLVPVAIALILGILLGEYLGGGAALWCGAAFAAAGVWLVLRFRHGRERWLLAALGVLVAAAGAARYCSSVDPSPDDVARFAADGPRLMVLEGILARSPRQSSPPADVFLPTVPYYTRSSMLIEAERVRLGDRWFPASGRVQAVVRQPLPAKGSPVNLGDRVQVVGVLLGPGRPANPGSFDVAAYLRTQGIRSYLRTDEWDAVRVTRPAADRLRAAVGVLQRWAVARLEAVPSEQGRAVVAAMLFGRKDMLDFDAGHLDGEDLQHAFLATGTVHYMAVSGFNVAMVVAPVLLLLRLLGAGRRVTSLVVATLVLVFVLMTELEPPVLRAAILFWVVCAAWLLLREPSPQNTLAAAVILVLVVRPGDLFSLSFQLSFLAVLGMMFLVGRTERDLLGGLLEQRQLAGRSRHSFWYGRVFRGMIMVSVAATLVTAPLVAGKFHILAWTSPVASVVLLPQVFVLTVMGMVQVGLGWIHPLLDTLLAIPLDGLGRLVAVSVKGMARAPGSYAYVGGFSTGWTLAAYAILALWVWRDGLRLSRRRVAIVALAATVVFTWTTGHHAPAGVRATFLAVGNGNTTVLEFPGGRTMLYDAGSSLSNVKAAESTTAPALWSLGVTRVDAIFISHPHFDHFKDILPLVERFGVRQVFVPPTFMRSRLTVDNGVIEALQARGVDVQFMSAGDRLAGTGNVDVRAVWPRGPASQTKAINDGSLVLAVENDGARLLLTGDLMPATMEALMATEPDLRANAMLWPHHGHDPDAMARFATRLGAKVLVISAGRPLKPQPAPPWVYEQGMVYCSTGEYGAIAVNLWAGLAYVKTFMGSPVQAEPEPEGEAED